jgi:hypothetical protein
VQADENLCVTSAAISLLIPWLASSEVLAALKVLYQKRKS